jgi:hypothetical protein
MVKSTANGRLVCVLLVLLVVGQSLGVRLRAKSGAMVEEAPTVPGEKDPGAAVVSTPVEPKSTALKVSPEDLVKASLPWEGMDKPAMMSRGAFPRTEPWDTATDSTQHVPFGNYHTMPAHPPPFIPGDVDHAAEHKAAAKRVDDWVKQVHTPSMPAIGPAFYGHQLKPTGYYPNPLTRYAPNLVAGTSFLQVGAAVMAPGAARPRHPKASAYEAKRNVASAYKAKRVGATSFLELASESTGLVGHQYGPYSGVSSMRTVQNQYYDGVHAGGAPAGSSTYGVGVPSPGLRIGTPNNAITHVGGFSVKGVIQANPTFVTPLINQPAVTYVYHSTKLVGQPANAPYGRPVQMYGPREPTFGMQMWQPPAPGTSSNLDVSRMPPRFQAVGAKLVAAAHLGHTSKAKGGPSMGPWFAPPVLDMGTQNPGVAVIGTDQSWLAAPSRQQFTGDFHPGNKPLPVRAYADDHPSPYNAAPTWPPAPPEPLFPLHAEHNLPSPTPALSSSARL